MSLFEAINLKSTLTRPPHIIGPANYHKQNGLSLPPEVSVLQHQLSDLVTLTNKKSIKINQKGGYFFKMFKIQFFCFRNIKFKMKKN